MKKLVVIKKPTKSKVLEVTAEQMRKLLRLNPFISVSEPDQTLIRETESHVVVGYLAGEINWLRFENTEPYPENAVDIWFINRDYFRENYEVIEEEK